MAKWQEGSITQASQFKKNNSAPLDDRDVVVNKADLIDPTVWTVSSTDTRYRGMIVYVRSENKHYTLITDVESDWNSYSGWREIGATAGTMTSVRVRGSGVINSSVSTTQTETLDTTISIKKAGANKVLVAHGEEGGDAEPNFNFITGDNFNNQIPNTFLSGPASGTSGKPGFRAITGTDLPTAAVNTKGAVKIYGSKSLSGITVNTTPTTGADVSRYYGIELDTTSDKAFVYVPKQTVNDSGTGNTIVGYSQIGDTITLTKGDRITGVNATETGTGNVVTSLSVNDNQEIVVNKGLTVGGGKFKIQSNTDAAVNTNFTANVDSETVGVKFVNGDNITVTAAAATSTTPATITMGVASGYSIPSDTKQSEWDAKVDTDTKNTAGSMNTTQKIFLVGPTSKATAAANDDKQTYTHGNNYIDNGWLYTGENQKVLVDADLDVIRQALASMEEWPTVTTSAKVVPSITTRVVTANVPTEINTYYKLGSATLGTNGSVQVAGGTLSMAKTVSIATTTTFTPTINNNPGYVIKNIISGMDYGYKTSLSDTTKSSDTTREEPVTVTPTHTWVDNSSTATFVVKIQINGSGWTNAATGTLSGGNITITYDTRLGNLAEGTTELKLVYTNTSTIARAIKSYTVPAVGNTYYSSNINNFDSTHVSSIGEQTGTLPAVATKYAEGSSSGIKYGREFIIYGVYPLYTNGSRNQSSAITGDDRTNGATGGTSTYNKFGSPTSDTAGPNYAASSTCYWYVSFGEINKNNQNLNKAYIYTPAVTGGKSVTIETVDGANSSTGSYDSGTVGMHVIPEAGTVTINSRPYKRWRIENPGGSEGANSYKIKITSANE